MLALDGERQQKQRVIDRRLAAADRAKRWYEQQVASAAVFSDEFDPTNPEKQRGRTMTESELIRLVKRLNPNLVVTAHPTKLNVTVISRAVGRYLRTAVTFAGPVVPEFSVMQRREQVVETPLPLDSQGNEVLSLKSFVTEKRRKAVARAIDLIINDPVKVYDNDSAIALLDRVLEDTQPDQSPVHQRIAQMGLELVRGWRTVLIRLYDQGLITQQQINQAVSQADRLTWAVKVGRREASCPV